jgi:hypothetical protein
MNNIKLIVNNIKLNNEIMKFIFLLPNWNRAINESSIPIK